MSKNSERIILVTGPVSKGGAVYQHLQKKGYKLRALVRDPRYRAALSERRAAIANGSSPNTAVVCPRKQ